MKQIKKIKGKMFQNERKYNNILNSTLAQNKILYRKRT